MDKIKAYLLIGLGGSVALSGITGFSMALTAIGGGMIFFGLRRLRKHNHQQLSPGPGGMQSPQFKMDDAMVQRLANRLGGKITAEDLARQTSLSLPEAKEKLEALHTKGVCQIDLDRVSQDGKIYYVFN